MADRSDAELHLFHALSDALDGSFGASMDQMHEFDSLLTLSDYEELSYTRNFPQLASFLCTCKDHAFPDLASGKVAVGPGFEDLAPKFALLPATCYKLYLKYRDTELDAAGRHGVVAQCFRNEDKPLSEHRFMSFVMKEFVYMGTAEGAQAHLQSAKAFLTGLGQALELNGEFEAASDPFFDQSSSVSISSSLFATKEEFVVKDVAIASLNYHRNYFGDKFDITLEGAKIHTSCFAFGMDRWVSAFRNSHLSFDEISSRLQQHG